jgi:hypothetical protein
MNQPNTFPIFQLILFRERGDKGLFITLVDKVS